MLLMSAAFQDGVRVFRPPSSDTLPSNVQAAIARGCALESVDGNVSALRRETSDDARARFGDVEFLRRVFRRERFDASAHGARNMRMISNFDSDVVMSATLLLRNGDVGWRLTVGLNGEIALFDGVGSARIEVPLFISCMPFEPLFFQFDRDVETDGAVVELDTVWLWCEERNQLLTTEFTQTIGERRYMFSRCGLLRCV